MKIKFITLGKDLARYSRKWTVGAWTDITSIWSLINKKAYLNYWLIFRMNQNGKNNDFIGYRN